MTDFVHVTGDVIDQGPKPREAVRSKTMSVAAVTTVEELKEVGWLPVRYVDDVFDPATQVREPFTGARVDDPVANGASEVVATYIVRLKTAQEIEDAKPEILAVGLWRVLRSKGVVTDADLPAGVRVP